MSVNTRSTDPKFGAEVNWRPLELLVGSELRPWFMHIGRVGKVHLYKHLGTRRYLNVDSAGNTYVYRQTGYVPLPLCDALWTVFNGWEVTP